MQAFAPEVVDCLWMRRARRRWGSLEVILKGKGEERGHLRHLRRRSISREPSPYSRSYSEILEYWQFHRVLTVGPMRDASHPRMANVRHRLAHRPGLPHWVLRIRHQRFPHPPHPPPPLRDRTFAERYPSTCAGLAMFAPPHHHASFSQQPQRSSVSDKISLARELRRKRVGSCRSKVLVGSIRRGYGEEGTEVQVEIRDVGYWTER